jgi:hypothetical protein
VRHPNSSLPAALDLTAFGGPVEEALELVAVFPAQFEEFGGGQVGGFGAEEGFKAPAEIGAVPGIEAIALGGEPVVAEELPHSVCMKGLSHGVGLFWCVGVS